MTMDIYCVMGNPIAHSKSPWIHTRFAELTGQTLHYDKRLISLDGFATAVSAFVAEGGRHGGVDGECRMGKGEPQLRFGFGGFEAAMGHPRQVGGTDIGAAIAGVGGRRDGTGVRRPHR